MCNMNHGALVGAPIELKGEDDADPAAIVTKALDELRGSIDQRFAAVETKSAEASKLNDRLDRIEARLNRPGAGVALQAENDNGGFERKAFVSFARRGEAGLSAEEVKSLTVANNNAIAPAEIGSELIKLLVQFSPIRQYARVVSVGAGEIRYPRRTASTVASWTSEVGDRTGSEPAYEQIALTPYELATFADVSNALLEDNAYNLESELLAEFAESFGKAEGTAFVTGDGTGKPKGLLNAAGITQVTTGNAGGFPSSNPADVMIGVFHALPNAHAQRGVWLMNRNTLATVRKWKDGQGRYLVLDPISEGAPVTLLGQPIVEAIDLPDIAANAVPVMFGDLQGYRIVDRVSLAVLRDPYSLATKGQVRFHARRRVGADVTNPDRFVKLRVAA